VADAHRSIHPDIPGVPWWAALLIATTATAIGYLIDAGSGHKELTHIFAGFYIAGCVAAVLAVRQEGVFTAIIQPPLILFCAVPGAYWLFHGGKIGHLKDLLINCGYPLIERFPLMLGTAGGVLLIGLARWYFGMSHRATSAGNTSDDAAGSTAAKSFVSGIAAKLSSVLRPESDENDSDEAPAARRVRSGSAAARSRRAGRSGPSDTRSARTRSRHARRPVDDAQQPPVERPGAEVAEIRRPTATTTRRNHPAGRSAGPGRMPNRLGKPVASRAPGAVPTSGRCRAAAVSTTTTGMTRPGRLSISVGMSPASGTTATNRPANPPTNLIGDAPHQPAPTRPTIPSRRSATAGHLPWMSPELSRAPSAAADHERTAGLRGDPRRNPGITTSEP